MEDVVGLGVAGDDAGGGLMSVVVDLTLAVGLTLTGRLIWSVGLSR